MDNCQHGNIDTQYEDSKTAFCRDCKKEFTVQELLTFFYKKQGEFESFIDDIQDDNGNLLEQVKERDGMLKESEEEWREYEKEWDNNYCDMTDKIKLYCQVCDKRLSRECMQCQLYGVGV